MDVFNKRLRPRSPVLPNFPFGRREYQHLQCDNTTICGCRGTTALQPTGGIVGLSHRGSRRINEKLTASKCSAFSEANLRFRGGLMVICVCYGWRWAAGWIMEDAMNGDTCSSKFAYCKARTRAFFRCMLKKTYFCAAKTIWVSTTWMCQRL